MMLLVNLAARNILRQRRRTLLTCLSMVGGYVLCVLSYSLSEGSYNNVIRIFTEDHTGHIQIHQGDYLKRPKLFKGIADTQEIRRKLHSVAGIQSFAPRIYAPALSYAADRNLPVQVVGIDPDMEASTSRLADKVNPGRWLSSNSDNGTYEALIGQAVADSLKLLPGEDIVLISQGADGSVANDIFQVVGIVGTRTSWDSHKVFLPLAAAQEFISFQGMVHEYAIVLKDANDIETVVSALTVALPTLTIDPWMVVESTFFKTMESDKRGNNFTMVIIIFIVFIGVLNTVLMSVLERTREFGVLKAIGSRPTTIALLISLETLMLSLGSILTGLCIGLPLIYWFANYGITLPQPVDLGGIEFAYMTGDFSFSVFFKPALLVLSFAVLVSIPPGIRAARVSPTQMMGSY